MERNTEALMAIRALVKQYGSRVKRVGDRFGLSQIEVNVLSFLENNPGMDTASDIIRLRGFSKALVSRGIDGLSEKGLLRRAADADDRRIVRLKLTPAAGEPAKALREERSRFFDRCFEGFTPAQRSDYIGMTGRIIRNLIR